MASHTLLTWEIDWVLTHPEGYESFQHQITVITNIIQRYERNYNAKTQALMVNKPFLQAFDKWIEWPSTGAEWKMKELRNTTV